jgi:hypothetical protein
LNDTAPPASLSGEAPVFKFAAVLLLLSWPANAEDRLYYTFSQWARLQDEDRIAYISGLLDTLAMAATEPAQTGHLSAGLEIRRLMVEGTDCLGVAAAPAYRKPWIAFARQKFTRSGFD